MPVEDKLGRLNLGIHIHQDFLNSEAFMDKLGAFVKSGDFFLPGSGKFKENDTTVIHFTLDGGRRDILNGTATVLSVHAGGGGLPRGIHLRWLETDARTSKNLAMIEDWQRRNAAREP